MRRQNSKSFKLKGRAQRAMLAFSVLCLMTLSHGSVSNVVEQKVHASEPSVQPLTYSAFEEEDLSGLENDQEFILARVQDNAVRFISDHFSKVSEDTVREIVDQAFITGKQKDIDPLLILAIIATESSFNPKASSSAGAKGLMQVHAKVHANRFSKFGGLKAVHDVTASIEVGTQILKEYLDKTGSLTGALKHYVGAARRPHDGGYSRKVLAMRNNLQLAAAGEIQAAKIQAKAPSKIPDDHKDHKMFATYTATVEARREQPNKQTQPDNNVVASLDNNQS